MTKEQMLEMRARLFLQDEIPEESLEEGIPPYFKPDPESAVSAVMDWPGAVYFSGKGRHIRTGTRLRAGTRKDDPVQSTVRPRHVSSQSAMLCTRRPGLG